MNFLYTKKGEKGGSNSSPLISMATYNKGDTRGNSNVVSWGGWCCLDVDEQLPTDLNVFLGSVPYQFLAYNTASSKEDHPKFRLVFPLTQELDAEHIPHFWQALTKELGVGDQQTKDKSRMFYVPASYPGAYSFIFESVERPVLNPFTIMAKHPYVDPKPKSFMDRLPESMKNAVIEHRKNQGANSDITWTSYRDCPFWPKQLEVEYRMIQNGGWYSMLYKIMVSIACSAVKREYPITAGDIVQLIKQFDRDTGNWYENRALETEANNALEYAYLHG